MLKSLCLLSLCILEKRTVSKSGQFVIVYSVTRLIIYFLSVPLCPPVGHYETVAGVDLHWDNLAAFYIMTITMSILV